MRIDLTGKTALVTGSSAGIGWGCARGLAEAGAAVVLVARRPDVLATACERLCTAVPGATVRSVATDLGDAAGCAQLLAAEPRCDILVNNLGVWEPKPFLDASDADWERLFSLNIMPGVRMSRAYMPGMMKAGWGRVIFFSSVEGIVVSGDSLVYGTMKAGVLGLSRGLAKLAQRSGVTVNAVLPGVTATEWVEDMVKGAAQPGQSLAEAGHAAVTARYPTSITQRIQSVEEVANLVVYLSSDQSSATTGSALRAEGGIIQSIC